jgi:nucleoid-associated protein EbfC
MSMFDALKLFGKIGEIKDKVKDAKERLQFMKVQEESEDQKIVILLNALKEIREIQIDNSYLNPEKKAALQAALVETLNKALQKAEKTGKDEIKKDLEGSLPEIPGLDLSNLF